MRSATGQHMAHVVIDVEYAELLLARPADVLQHIARLAHGQRRRRLVEEKQLCAGSAWRA